MVHSFHSSVGTELTTVESFNLETKTWQWEPSFPFVPVSSPATIPYENTFLSVGGSHAGNNVDYIYMVRNLIMFEAHF